MNKWLMGIVLSFFTQSAAAGVAILQDTKSERDGDSFVTELIFDQSIPASNVGIEFINQTVQLNIKGASIKAGKELRRLEDDKVRSLFTYQLEPDLMRTRIIHQDSIDASRFDGYVQVESTPRGLKITIDDPAAARRSQAKNIQWSPPIDLGKEIDKALEKAQSDQNAEEESELLQAAQMMNSNKKSEAKKTPEKREDQIALGATIQDGEKNEKSSSGKTEAEIPLNLEEKKADSGMSSLWLRLAMSLGVIVLVGIALAFGVKKFAKDKIAVGGNLKVKVVSQHSLGPKKSLAIIHVAGESILIGITDHNISMIKSLSLIDDEIPEEVPQSFGSEMSRIQVQDKVKIQTPTSRPKSEKDEEFALGNIKDLISSKLKEMRPL